MATDREMQQPHSNDINETHSRDLLLNPRKNAKKDFAKENQNHRSFMGKSSFSARNSVFMLMSVFVIFCLAWLFYYSDQLASNSLSHVKSVNSLANLISKIELGITSQDDDKQDFLATKDIRFVNSYKERLRVLRDDLRILINDPVAGEIHKLSVELHKGVVQHSEQFAKIVKLSSLLELNKKNSLAYNAKSSLVRLEKNIGELSPKYKSNTVTLSTERLKSSDLILQQDPTLQNLRNVQIDSSLLKKTINSIPSPKVIKNNLFKGLKAYLTDTNKLTRTRIIYTGEISKLDEINSSVEPNIATLTNYIGNLNRLALQQNSINHQRVRQLLVGGTSGLLLLLILSAVILMRSISRPIQNIIEVAMEFTHGNVSAQIPYLGNLDETGKLSNALTIFRENMLQADRLRKDLEVALNEKNNDLPTQMLQSTDESKQNPIKSTVGTNTERNSIKEISHQLTMTSQNASVAAEDAERTEIMVSGLDNAAKKIEEIETLMVSINDQMSLLAVQAKLNNSEINDSGNLISLYADRASKESNLKVGSVNDRIMTIQGGTKRAISAVQTIKTSILDINEIAREFSTTASKEALKSANELLKQSEDLRSMLDNLLEEVETNNPNNSQLRTNKDP